MTYCGDVLSLWIQNELGRTDAFETEKAYADEIEALYYA